MPARLTFIILAAGAAGMACLLALLPAAGHDQSWLLLAASRVLHGAPLYGSEVFETNPPLIIWLSMIPAALAPLLHLPDTALGKFFTLLVEFAVASLCLRLTRLARPAAPKSEPEPLWFLPAFAFAFITIFAVLPARDLGQRDHFLILFVLPYVFAVAARMRSLPIPTPFAILIGVLALAGIALKPHQILIPIVLEAALLVRASGKSRPTLLRPEFLSMVAAGLVFLLAIELFAPLYFTLILPLVSDTYWAYHQLTFPQLVAQSIQLHILLLLDLALLLHTGWRRAHPLPRTLFLAGCASTLAFYVQGTGWYYQQIPALTLLTLALTFLLVDLAQRSTRAFPRRAPAFAAALALLAIALTTHFTGYPFTTDRAFPLDSPDPAFFAGLRPGTAVITLSPTVEDSIQPARKFHLILGQRYPALLMLPALLRAEQPAASTPRLRSIPHQFAPGRLAELDRIQHLDMVQDILRWTPRLILVQRCQDPAVHCQVLEDRHDDLLAFFLRDPTFRTIFSHYRLIRTSGAYDAYALN